MAENLLNLNEVSLQRRALRENTALKVSKYGVFSGTYFPAFGLNTERYDNQLECGKIRTRKNSVFGRFSRSRDCILIF